MYYPGCDGVCELLRVELRTEKGPMKREDAVGCVNTVDAEDVGERGL